MRYTVSTLDDTIVICTKVCDSCEVFSDLNNQIVSSQVIHPNGAILSGKHYMDKNHLLFSLLKEEILNLFQIEDGVSLFCYNPKTNARTALKSDWDFDALLSCEVPSELHIDAVINKIEDDISKDWDIVTQQEKQRVLYDADPILSLVHDSYSGAGTALSSGSVSPMQIRRSFPGLGPNDSPPTTEEEEAVEIHPEDFISSVSHIVSTPPTTVCENREVFKGLIRQISQTFSKILSSNKTTKEVDGDVICPSDNISAKLEHNDFEQHGSLGVSLSASQASLALYSDISSPSVPPKNHRQLGLKSWLTGPSRLSPFGRPTPLRSKELAIFMDPNGAIIQKAALRAEVFKRGIDPTLRKAMWPILLDIFPRYQNRPDTIATLKVRKSIMKSFSSKYAGFKQGWESALVYHDKFVTAINSAVRKDANRTDRYHPFFKGPDSNHHTVSLGNVLMTYAYTHPSIGYVQGMSDLAAPLLMVMDGEESSTFACLCGLMLRCAPNFLPSQASSISSGSSIASSHERSSPSSSSPTGNDQSGSLSTASLSREGERYVLTKFRHLRQLVQFYCPSKVYNHLLSVHAEEMFFAYRWLLLEMKREVALDDVMSLWDVMFASIPDCKLPGKAFSLTESAGWKEVAAKKASSYSSSEHHDRRSPNSGSTSPALPPHPLACTGCAPDVASRLFPSRSSINLTSRAKPIDVASSTDTEDEDVDNSLLDCAQCRNCALQSRRKHFHGSTGRLSSSCMSTNERLRQHTSHHKFHQPRENDITPALRLHRRKLSNDLDSTPTMASLLAKRHHTIDLVEKSVSESDALMTDLRRSMSSPDGDERFFTPNQTQTNLVAMWEGHTNDIDGMFQRQHTLLDSISSEVTMVDVPAQSHDANQSKKRSPLSHLRKFAKRLPGNRTHSLSIEMDSTTAKNETVATEVVEDEFHRIPKKLSKQRNNHRSLLYSSSLPEKLALLAAERDAQEAAAAAQETDDIDHQPPHVEVAQPAKQTVFDHADDHRQALGSMTNSVQSNLSVVSSIASSSRRAPFDLPGPSEIGKDNPFLMFLCLAAFKSHEAAILKGNLDFNDINVLYDKQTRSHNVNHLLVAARALYADYLGRFVSSLTELSCGDSISGISHVVPSAIDELCHSKVEVGYDPMTCVQPDMKCLFI